MGDQFSQSAGEKGVHADSLRGELVTFWRLRKGGCGVVGWQAVGVEQQAILCLELEPTGVQLMLSSPKRVSCLLPQQHPLQALQKQQRPTSYQASLCVLSYIISRFATTVCTLCETRKQLNALCTCS